MDADLRRSPRRGGHALRSGAAASAAAHEPGAAPGPRFERSAARRGRALLACADGALYASQHYAIWRSDDDGASWRRAASLPRGPLRRAAELSRLASRLLRHEVRALARLSDGSLVAANREGVFAGPERGGALAASAIADGGLAVLPPLRIGVGARDRVVFGEYGSPRGRPMRLFASDDGGRRFEPVHSFAPGEILHVHNVVWDAARDHWWVLTGDFDPQPGIGILSADWRRFEWLARGEQRFRAVEVFDLGDRLVYVTDSQLEPNTLVSFEKDSGRAERLQAFEGSCIYACRCGPWYAVATTVEPSAVNPSRDATVWVSRDLERWHCILRARKDRWHADYFQFGSLVLPHGASPRPVLAVSGQAVAGFDGQLAIGRIAEPGGAEPR